MAPRGGGVSAYFFGVAPVVAARRGVAAAPAPAAGLAAGAAVADGLAPAAGVAAVVAEGLAAAAGATDWLPPSMFGSLSIDSARRLTTVTSLIALRMSASLRIVCRWLMSPCLIWSRTRGSS